MGILNDLLKRIETVNNGLTDGDMIRDVVQMYPNDILELQRIQLLQGKASNGEDIHPFYSEDLKPGGYFYSVETAAAYAAWKQEIDYPYTVQRNPDAPNLYINGRFHSELDVDFNPDKADIVGATSYAQNIIDKYGSNTFGLTMGNWMVIMQERGGYDLLIDKLKQILYGTN